MRRRIYGSFIEALDPSGQNKQCSEKRQVYLQSKKSFGGLASWGLFFVRVGDRLLSFRVTVPEEPDRALSLSKTYPWEQSFQVNCGQLPMIIIQHLKKIGAMKTVQRVTNSKNNDTIGI